MSDRLRELDAVERSIREDVAALRALVYDEDSDCIARELRRARLHAFEHVLAIIDETRRWEW